jgi:ubiquinone/menaquinone biosynthesis C-methylase UbiE
MNQKEENPFEDPIIAQEWINSVENEKDMSRDKVIYPRLKNWASKFNQTNTIVEIGSGQGICSEKIHSKAKYVGIEPSVYLIKRAKEKYRKPNRIFLIGNAYILPISNATADAVFIINVWFHLGNLEKSAEEMKRILKPNGKFLIINANPDAYDIWEKFYHSPEKIGKKIIGKVDVPINPLSRNIFYKHSLNEITSVLNGAGLIVDSVEKIGETYDNTGKQLFISINGQNK